MRSGCQDTPPRSSAEPGPLKGSTTPLKALKWGEWAAKPQSQNSFKPGATAPAPWRTAVTVQREGFALRPLAGLRTVICCG
jgi:hypothetical protein